LFLRRTIGALGKDGVTSSIYIRALLRGTTLRPLMEKDTADVNKIGLKDELQVLVKRKIYI